MKRERKKEMAMALAWGLDQELGLDQAFSLVLGLVLILAIFVVVVVASTSWRKNAANKTGKGKYEK